MRILVIGGTRYFGIPMVEELLAGGHEVTLATRGLTPDPFGDRISRLRMDLTEEDSVKGALAGRGWDVVIDKMGYGSKEIKWILESLECDRFVHMSTAGVYRLEGFGIPEEAFDGGEGELVWCKRGELPYDDAKRNAERALCQVYGERNWVSVRAPFVLGKRDYTGRLRFYAEHTLLGRAMYVDNLDEHFCVAACDELGAFLAFLALSDFRGPINACSAGTLSIREILDEVEKRSGCRALLDREGDPAPYNGTKNNSLCTDRAAALGWHFRDCRDWIGELLEHDLAEIRSNLADERS